MIKKNSQKDFSSSYSFNNSTFPVTIVFCRRKTCTIQLNEYGQIHVRVPHRYSKRKALHFLHSHESWIQKHIMCESPFLSPYQYKEGEIFQILGEDYSLRIITSSSSSVHIQNNNLVVCTPVPTKEQIKKQLQRWYRKQSIMHLTQSIQTVEPQITSITKRFPKEYRFRLMKRRWGSCNNQQVITLNTDLFKAPVPAIEYVIIHELCHLVYLHHGVEFKELLTDCCPDWIHRKELLKRICSW